MAKYPEISLGRQAWAAAELHELDNLDNSVTTVVLLSEPNAASALEVLEGASHWCSLYWSACWQILQPAMTVCNNVRILDTA